MEWTDFPSLSSPAMTFYHFSSSSPSLCIPLSLFLCAPPPSYFPLNADVRRCINSTLYIFHWSSADWSPAMTSASLIPRIPYLILAAVNEQYPSLLCLTVDVNEWCIMICNIKVVLFYSYIYIIWLPLACVSRECSGVWEQANAVLPRPLSPWCMAANYSDKSLSLLLLPATRMHLMPSGREEEEESVCDAFLACLCLLFWVTKCSVVTVPSGGHCKVNWM